MGIKFFIAIPRTKDTWLLVSFPGVSGDGILHQVALHAFPEEHFLLFSDADEEYWQCIVEVDELFNQLFPMKCLHEGATLEDSEFLSSDSESASLSSGTPSSSNYVQSEEESDTEAEETNCKRDLHSRRQKNTIEFEVGGRSAERTLKLVAAVMMETSSEHDDVLELRSGNQKRTAPTRRETRGTSKLLSKKKASAPEKGEGSRAKVGRGKTTAGKESSAVKKKKKATQVSPAVVNAVFGNLQSCVADAGELRRKRDEDALKCGRIPRMVGDASKTTSYRTEMGTEVEDSSMLKDSIQGDQLIKCAGSHEKSRPKVVSTDFQRITSEFDKHGPPITTDVQNRPVVTDIPHDGTGFNVQHEIPTWKATSGSNSRRMLETTVRKEKEMHPYYGHQEHDSRSPGIAGMIQSASVDYDNNHYKRSRKGKEAFTPERRSGHPQWSPDVYEGSRRGGSRGADVRFSSRQPRSRSSSPEYEDRGRRRRRQWDHDGYMSRSPVYQRRRPGPRGHSSEEGNGSGRLNSTDSSSSDSRYQYRRSASPHRRRGKRRGSPSSRRSTSPSRSLLRFEARVGGAYESRLQNRRIEDVVTPSPSVDRTRRRRKQSARECQRLQRQSEGKKPFYLTVDIEGRPYGPGRPAWIADINKLAAGLDPSCTDIRKQAHGDICIFKDRLNEEFEYSSEVSEHHLRGLIGKAVTRRRTELITLINSNGDRPANFHDDIWQRMEMLASSKQREKRTEQGRYANKCRRTISRTGAAGEEGIRERLREVFGRSPEPEEMEQEMHRDKGFGKPRLRTTGENKSRPHERSDDFFNKDGTNLRTSSSGFQHFQSDDDETAQQQCEVEDTQQRKDAFLADHGKEVDCIRGGSDARCGSGGRHLTGKQSKDQYIAELEKELRSIKGGTLRKSF